MLQATMSRVFIIIGYECKINIVYYIFPNHMFIYLPTRCVYIYIITIYCSNIFCIRFFVCYIQLKNGFYDFYEFKMFNYFIFNILILYISIIVCQVYITSFKMLTFLVLCLSKHIIPMFNVSFFKQVMINTYPYLVLSYYYLVS